MSRIYARAGRLQAQPDRSLDPSRSTRAGGFLRASTDTGRTRATRLPNARTSIADFGPLLYYRMSDARSDAGTVTVPNRTGLNASLTSLGTEPAIVPFLPSDPRYASELAVQLVDGANTVLRTPALAAFLASNLSGAMEIVTTMCLTGTPGADRLFLSNLVDVSGFGDGSIAALIATQRHVSASRQVLAGFDVFNSAALPIDAVRIFHLVVRKTGPSNAILDMFINGVQSASLITAAVGEGAWVGDYLSLGAEDSGTYLAPPVRVLDMAVYPRALTRDERMAMFSGAFAEHESVPVYPRLEDVLDLSAGSVTWHPDRAPVVAAGVCTEADGFDVTGNVARERNAAGRAYLVMDGAASYCDDGGAGIVTGAADSLTMIVAVKDTDGSARNSLLSPYAATGDRIEMTSAGELRLSFGGVFVLLSGLGTVEDRHAVAVAQVQQSSGSIEMLGAAWDPGDSSYTTELLSGAGSATPVGTALMRLGASFVPSNYMEGSLFGAALIKRELTEYEVSTVLQFFFQEFNV